ncbi:MAG TPA: PQQ-binding-like beta-propeller repeat protein [Lacipirellulaceae bacterium]|nr:PQQ-binding-like beta-propeller repeat protein [Lacipirellulaceae bacterium]
MPRMTLAVALLVCLLLVGARAPGAAAADWPQWMGPDRDNVWKETGLLERFPTGGPKVLWRSPVGYGFAGPAVAGGRVFVPDMQTEADLKVDNFGRKEFTGTERLLCLDETTGAVIWKYEYPVTYAISYPAGPRCTPVIADGKVYFLGAEGNLACLDAATGAVAWSKNFKSDYGAETPLWGYAAHPLVDGQKLICVVGGPGSHAVAFDKNTGDEIWKSLTSPDQGYSPPTIIQAAGVRQLILARPDAITAVNPETGAEYWSVPYAADGGCVIMSPLQVADFLFVGGHQNKSLLLKLAATAEGAPSAEIVWKDKGKDALSPINVQPFGEEGVLYGVNQNGAVRAIDLAAGEQLWETAAPISDRPLSSGTAMIVRQGDRSWMFTESGHLVIGRFTKAGFEELDRAQVIEPTNVANGRDIVWTMPAFANRKAFIRNDQECICVDLAASP